MCWVRVCWTFWPSGSGDLAVDDFMGNAVEPGVPGGEVAGARPFVVLAEIGEHGYHAVGDAGGGGGQDGPVQGGLGVLAG
jgi:hypothetical protein